MREGGERGDSGERKDTLRGRDKAEREMCKRGGGEKRTAQHERIDRKEKIARREMSEECKETGERADIAETHKPEQREQRGRRR